MSDPLPIPRSTQRAMQFDNGVALGVSNRWRGGQYCTIFTEVGLVGCGIYDVVTPAHFGQVVAICRGTPEQPLTEPEDLLDARIVDMTPQAKALGVELGMTGRQAVELLLRAGGVRAS